MAERTQPCACASPCANPVLLVVSVNSKVACLRGTLHAYVPCRACARARVRACARACVCVLRTSTWASSIVNIVKRVLSKGDTPDPDTIFEITDVFKKRNEREESKQRSTFCCYCSCYKRCRFCFSNSSMKTTTNRQQKVKAHRQFKTPTHGHCSFLHFRSKGNRQRSKIQAPHWRSQVTDPNPQNLK